MIKNITLQLHVGFYGCIEYFFGIIVNHSFEYHRKRMHKGLIAEAYLPLLQILINPMHNQPFV